MAKPPGDQTMAETTAAKASLVFRTKLELYNYLSTTGMFPSAIYFFTAEVNKQACGNYILLIHKNHLSSLIFL